MGDRRRWPRIEVALRVAFSFNRPEDLSRHSIVRDVSLGGVFIATDQIRPKGTLVRLQLEFHNGAIFRAEGRVVRVVPPEIAVMKGIQAGIGVSFTQIGERSRQVLEDALAGQIES